MKRCAALCAASFLAGAFFMFVIGVLIVSSVNADEPEPILRATPTHYIF